MPRSRAGIAVLLSTVTALGMAAVALGDNPESRCTAATLTGLYVFTARGFALPVPGPQPKAIVEVIRFKGDGTLSVQGGTRSVNGTVAREVPGVTGTYTVGDLLYPDAACAGSLTFSGGPSFDLFVRSTGEDLWMIQTNPNNVFQGKATRVAP